MNELASLQGLIHTVGLVMGFCAGLSILGGAIIFVGAFFLRKHLDTMKSNVQLKDLAVRNEIESVKKDLTVSFEQLRGDFKALKERVDMALSEQKSSGDALSQKHERTLGVMKKMYEQSETRFKAVEARLEKTHFIVERIRTGGG